MFGIGLGEFLIVAIVLLIAVGPKSMPKLMRAVGKGIREFRSATQELRNQVGLDELMRDEELREQWRDPLGLNRPEGAGSKSAPKRDGGVAQADLEREYPPEGVDLREAGPEPSSGEPSGDASSGDASSGDASSSDASSGAPEPHPEGRS